MSGLPLSGEAYRDAVAAAVADGWRFASLHATTDHGKPAVRTLLASPEGDVRLESVDAGGRVHAFAGVPGGAPVDANLVHYRHLRLVGSTGSTLADYRRARDMAASGSIRLERLPSRAIALEEIPQILLDPHPDPRTLRFVARP